MSQYIPEDDEYIFEDDDSPLEPLSITQLEDGLELDDIATNMNMIEEALQTVGKKKYELPELPTYYDDILMQLIDAVPLE